MSCWDDVSRHIDQKWFWMADPRIRRRIGQLVSGDPDRGFSIDWFVRRMAAELPFERALSVGCGTGGLERHLASLGAASRITGVDASAVALDYARDAAEKAGLAGIISYELAGAHDSLRSTGGWNAVFFHGSLHHLDRLPELFALLRSAMAPGGILFLDEYVGPSRSEWGWLRMVVPNLVYLSLPRAARRTKIVRTPVTDEDPTEMISASEIAPLVRRHFEILEWRDYGGNLLSLVYPNLAPAGEGKARECRERALDRLIRVEDFLLRHTALPGGRSLYAVVIARR